MKSFEKIRRCFSQLSTMMTVACFLAQVPSSLSSSRRLALASVPPPTRPPHNIYSPFDEMERVGGNFTHVLTWYPMFVCGRFCHGRSKYMKVGCSICYCDDACFSYGDCCPRAFLERPNASIVIPPACMPRSEDPFSYYAVTTCLQDFALTEDGEKCRNSSLHSKGERPVIDVQTQVSYTNKFCAHCNNVTRYKAWDVVINCTLGDPARAATASSAKELLRLLLEEKICDIDFQPPEGVTARACTPVSEPLISTCNVTGKWPVFDERVVRACAAYRSPVLQFRNSFCYFCNSNIAWEKSSLPVYSTRVGKVSLVAVLNLQGDQSDSAALPDSRTPRQKSTSCETASFLDPASRRCRPIACSNGKILNDGACVSIVSKSNFFGYKGIFYVTMTTQVTKLPDLQIDMRNFVSFMEFKVSPSFTVYEITMQTTSVFCKPNVAVLEMVISVLLLPEQVIPVDESESNLLDYFINVFNDFDRSGRITMKLSERIDAHEHTSFTTTGCRDYNVTIREQDLRYGIWLPTRRDSVGFLRKDIGPLLICPQIALTSEEYIYHNETNSLLVIATGAILRHPNFSLKNKLARVCVDEYLSGFNRTTVQETNTTMNNEVSERSGNFFKKLLTTTAGIVSFSCTVVSLTFLALTLTAYVFFKELRTISGVCNMCMVGVWFLAQAVFTFGAEETKIAGLCVALGILAHYLWLSATFWMNACTLLLFSRLMFPLRARIELYSRAKVLGLSSVYALLSPALIVASAVTANFFLHGDLGYGGAICYIKRAATRRYGLALPVGCLVVANLCLFVFTVIRLRRGSTVSSSVESKIGLFACTKLSVITGLSWLFLFVYEALPYQAIEYVAIVLFGLQGVVIFVVFAFSHFLAHLRGCF